MKKIILIGVLLISAYLAFAEDAPYFTNDSLKKYRSGPMAVKEQPAENVPTPNIKPDTDKKTNNESERDYYCDRATKLKNEIAAAKDKFEAAKKSTVREKVTSSSNPLSSHYESFKDVAAMQNAKQEIELLEKSLANLEDDAHRKGIPPGWLRCQW